MSVDTDSGPAPEPTPDPLEVCASEPIRVPGSIQPHGALLAVSEPELTIVVASANAAQFCGVAPEPDLVGRPLADAVGPEAANLIAEAARGVLEELNPLALPTPAGLRDGICHRSDGLLLVELEPSDPIAGAGGASALGWYQRLRSHLQRLQATVTAAALVEELTAQVAELTGFDRVMAYRFDPEWNGEVVAERRRGDLEPFLGLRYPASDIPPQARALYTVNWLRLIPDATYRPVPLTPPRDTPLDLSSSVLRSVSPVHLEYLANMGVRASMSVSVVVEGRLWGLVACHHYAGPRHPPYRVRAAIELLGRMASVLLGEREKAAQAAERAVLAGIRGRLLEGLGRSDTLDPGRVRAEMEALEADLLALTGATGAAMLVGDEILTVGRAPAPAVARRVAHLLLDPPAPPGSVATPASSESLASLDPALEADASVAAGALAVPIDPATIPWLVWFRPEVRTEVTWSGDPRSTKVVHDDGGLRVSPRQSFDAWVEQVGLHSQPWSPAEVEEAAHFAATMADTVARRSSRLHQLAAALQRTLLLEALPQLPGLEAAVRYLPSGTEPVGGDWYDVVYLPNGRVALVVGDVAGHGLAFASVMAQLRQGLRAYLLREPSGAAALARLNELVHWLLPGQLATAVVVEVEPATGALSVVSAGHQPPLLARPGQTELIEGGRGPALGVVDQPRYEPVTTTLEPDASLLLFSDGLVERRGQRLDDRIRTLAELAMGLSHGGLEELADTVVSTMQDPEQHDDLTLLAVRRTR